MDKFKGRKREKRMERGIVDGLHSARYVSVLHDVEMSNTYMGVGVGVQESSQAGS